MAKEPADGTMEKLFQQDAELVIMLYVSFMWSGIGIVCVGRKDE
jgi:hypothetical protein